LAAEAQVASSCEEHREQRKASVGDEVRDKQRHAERRDAAHATEVNKKRKLSI
jgi:hypothetical protein